MIYFLFFSLAFIILSTSKSVNIKILNLKIKLRISEITVIGLFTLLTASRAMTVGTDTVNYYYSAKKIISYLSISSIIHGYYIEPGYGLLEFISMKWFGDYHFIFVIESIVLLVGLFSFIHNFEDKISVPLSFLVFFVFYYNTSLNISRQFIAVGIGLYATKYLLNDMYIKYMICCLVACLFHSTGIMLFVGLIVYRYLFISDDRRSFYRRVIILVIFIVGMIIAVRPLTKLLANMGLIPVKYIDFLQKSEVSSSVSMTFLANLPLLLLLLFYGRKLIDNDEKNKLAITMYLLGFFITMINTLYGNVGRLAIFWTIWQVVLYPECYLSVLNNQKNVVSKVLTKIVFVILLLLYWYYCIIVRNFGNTIPYESDLFNWLNLSI